MKQFTIGVNDAGQRIDRFLSKAMPELTSSQIQKGIRTKNIKRNGLRCYAGDKLGYGDIMSVYVTPAGKDKRENNLVITVFRNEPEIVYEDKNIILFYKPSGLPCQENGQINTLENYLRNSLYSRKQWNPEDENSFVPSLCHRLDRNTQGLVIAAKNAQALRIINEKIKNREISKYYLCVVHGHPKPLRGELFDYLFKDKNRVIVHKNRKYGAKTALLRYQTLETRDSLTMLECELITGRTHQIRVQWASRGFPLLGDGKYGSQPLDKPYGRKKQALSAYRIDFNFKTPADTLEYLKDKCFSRPKTFDQMVYEP